MFAYIRGVLVSSCPLQAIVEANGIGYRVLVPLNVFSKLPQTGSHVFLHTSYVVREFSHTLYGFLCQQELELFETLMGISGIGPKSSLSIIGHLPLVELQKAVNSNNIPQLCKVPGIGKKTAERLIIEMRDKLDVLSPRQSSDSAEKAPDHFHSQKVKDAMNALVNLGYSQAIAQKAIKKTLENSSEEVNLAVLITTALKHV